MAMWRYCLHHLHRRSDGAALSAHSRLDLPGSKRRRARSSLHPSLTSRILWILLPAAGEASAPPLPPPLFFQGQMLPLGIIQRCPTAGVLAPIDAGNCAMPPLIGAVLRLLGHLQMVHPPRGLASRVYHGLMFGRCIMKPMERQQMLEEQRPPRSDRLAVARAQLRHRSLHRLCKLVVKREMCGTVRVPARSPRQCPPSAMI